MKFSPEQRLAVETSGVNLLVSAAAGAGKTSVLAGRVLYAITQEVPPLDIENLLVVTFTRAAAREMKDRIGGALRETLSQYPDHARARRQLALLERASISTLDSFCQELVRQNFHVLDINPGFGVLDAEEGELLWAETLDGVFEAHYRDDGPRGVEFRALVDAFGGRRDDARLAGEVRRAADFLRTTARPAEWKARVLAALGEFGSPAGKIPVLERTFWGRRFIETLEAAHADIEARFDWLLRELAARGIPDAKLAGFAGDLRDASIRARRSLAAGEWTEWQQILADCASAKMPRKGPRVPPEYAEMRNLLKARVFDPARKQLTALAKFQARFSPEDWIDGVRSTSPLIGRFLALTEDALDAYAREKRQIGALDFNDIERLALDALSARETKVDSSAVGADETNGTNETARINETSNLSSNEAFLTPGPVALQYRDRFERVLVDEYQDINELQAAILHLVSRQNDAQGRAPNLFAVGDVKQSIYGFRLAEPEIFLDAYRRAQSLRPDAPQSAASAGALSAGTTENHVANIDTADFRIDLPRNYRCRRPVIDAVNSVFERLMDVALGGIPYDDSARLVQGRGASDPPADLPPSKNPDNCPVEWLLVDSSAPIVSRADGGESAVAFSPNGEPSDADTRGEEGAHSPDGGAENEAASEENEGEGEDAAAPEAEPALLEREAYALASRLWSLVGRRADGQNADLWIEDSGGVWRPVQWGDIVILMRSMTGADVFAAALRHCGIPVKAPPGGNLLDALEIRDLVSVLEILDNPCQDIPLAAYLRSPFCRFSADDLMRIRLGASEGDFYAAARAFSAGDSGAKASANSDDSSDLAERCRAALERIERWRALSRQVSVAELIDRILAESQYRAAACAGLDGDLRESNIETLRERAAQFDTFANRGLARFLRFLRRLAESGQNPASGDNAPPGENAVRLLSIHRAKGLEFPVVVIANLSGRFNLSDLYNPIVTDRRGLIGMRAPCKQRGVHLPALHHEAVRAGRRIAMLSEEMRLLYVAMTRARDLLILSGTVARPREAFDAWRLWSGGAKSETLPVFLRSSARCLLDWIGPALAGSAELAAKSEEARAEQRRRGASLGIARNQSVPLTLAHIIERIEITGANTEFAKPPEAEAAEGASNAFAGDCASWEARALESLRRIAAASSAPELPGGLRAKMSVTEIKRLWDYASEPEDGAPGWPFAPPASARKTCKEFSAKESEESPGKEERPPQLGAAERGTITHLAMRHLDYSRADSEEQVRGQVAALINQGLLPAVAADAVDCAAVARFFQGELGRRLASLPAGAIRREVPFTALVPAGEVYGFLPETARARFRGESIVVQGVADCVAAASDGLLLLDWKTDQVSAGPALEERAISYAEQIRLYARALSEIHRRPVQKAVLVFLWAGIEREVPLDRVAD